MRTGWLETVDALMYRSSQAPSMSVARADGAARPLETVQGYGAAMDTFANMVRLADMMEHEASKTDIRIQITLNGTRYLPECYLAEYMDVIHAELNEHQ